MEESQILIGYTWMYISALFIFISLLIPRKGKFAYMRGICISVFACFWSIFFTIPFILAKKKEPKALWFLKYTGKGMVLGSGLNLEIRMKGLSKKKGQGVVVMNHQSFIDMMGVAQLHEYYGDSIGVAKKEVQYLVPVIVNQYIFIDRKDKTTASSLAHQAISFYKKYKDGKIMIFPEGTRNDSGGFLPFKKGAFRIAIDNQVPIYPCVFSPYYFIKKDEYFNKGDIIISLLDPIDTTGLTEKDTDSLIEKTRNLMLDEFKRLGEELKSRRSKFVGGCGCSAGGAGKGGGCCGGN